MRIFWTCVVENEGHGLWAKTRSLSRLGSRQQRKQNARFVVVDRAGSGPTGRFSAAARVQVFEPEAVPGLSLLPLFSLVTRLYYLLYRDDQYDYILHAFWILTFLVYTTYPGTLIKKYQSFVFRLAVLGQRHLASTIAHLHQHSTEGAIIWSPLAFR